MIEYFAIFAIGILVGILGTLMIVTFINRTAGEDIDFDDLDETLFVDEDFEDIPEDAEIKLPEEGEIHIPTGEDVKNYEKNMEELKNHGDEDE